MTKKIFLSLFLLFISINASAGLLSFLESFVEGSEQKRFHRMLYFKLPIEDIKYHWKFLNREQFLMGKLLLEFTTEGSKQKEIIFSNGKLNANWKVIGDSDFDSDAEDKTNNVIYFGFVSHSKYWFNKSDSAKITLINNKPLSGWGYDFKGDLKAGKHVSKAKEITQYEDDIHETTEELEHAKAFINHKNWQTSWPLNNRTPQGTGWGFE